MSDKHYVTPPSSQGKEFFNQLKEIYRYLHPDYWKRKLFHLVVVVPSCFLLYYGFLTQWYDFAWSFHVTYFFEILLSGLLTILAAFFYPFSLYWYKRSFIGQLLNSITHFGGFWVVIGKILLTVIGGVVIAGFFSPLFGILTWRKCIKKNMIIGDEIDFQ